MYELIAIDLDGTLLDDDKNITKENLKALNWCKKQNIITVLASGRGLSATRSIAKKISSFNDYHICCNGGLIFNTYKEDHKIIKTLNQNDFNNIIDDLRYINASVGVQSPDGFYYEINTNADMLKEKVFYSDKDLIKINLKNVKEPILITCYINNKKQYDEIFDIIKKYDINITQSEKNWIEIFPKGVNKYNALKIIADSYNIDKKNIIAIGDQTSDIEMVKNAGLGICVKNACKDLKDVSDMISPYSNNQNAVYHIIKEILKCSI